MRRAILSFVILTAVVEWASAIAAKTGLPNPLTVYRPAQVLAAPHELPPGYEARHQGGVDPGVGLYIREDDDLLVPDSIPLILRRTYLSGDHVSRQFGVGGTHQGEWYLIGDGKTFQWAELVLANGGRIHYDRTSSGTSYFNAAFEHRSSPTRFFASTLSWAWVGWTLRFVDGSTARFQDCGPDDTRVCALVDLEDTDGHHIRYIRDRSGLLTRIQGPTQAISFTYDDKRRISRAVDTLGHRVNYVYDSLGRLVRVVTADGTVRAYTYDDHDQMLTIDEPGWVIENTFDATGRVSKQITRYPDDDRPHTIAFAYQVLNGGVRSSDVREYDGTLTRTAYNVNSYKVSEVHDADGPNPVTVTFERSESTNIVRALTVRCLGAEGHIVRTVPAWSGEEESAAWDVIARECR